MLTDVVDDEDRMTKNVPPPPDPAHESSSLFSLSSLEQMASGKHESLKIPSEDEGSGLLDIHALTEAAAHGNRVVPRPTPMPALLKSPIAPAAPAGMPARVKATLGVMGLTIFALGGATLYLAKRHEPVAAVQSEPTPQLSVPAAAAPEAPSAQVAVAAPTTVVRENEPAELSAPVAAPAPAGSKHRNAAGRGAREAAPVAAPAARPVVAAPAPRAPADRSINDLLDQALTPGPSGHPTAGVKAARPAPMAAGSATPSRADVLAAMQAVSPKVKACGGTGMAVVKITLSGRTGHVTDAVVDGQSDAKARACIMREVSRAKLAPFTNASFSVTYPFKL
jgi:hypothetical protein